MESSCECLAPCPSRIATSNLSAGTAQDRLVWKADSMADLWGQLLPALIPIFPSTNTSRAILLAKLGSKCVTSFNQTGVSALHARHGPLPGQHSGLQPGYRSLFQLVQKNPWPQENSQKRCAAKQRPQILRCRGISQCNMSKRLPSHHEIIMKTPERLLQNSLLG